MESKTVALIIGGVIVAAVAAFFLLKKAKAQTVTSQGATMQTQPLPATSNSQMQTSTPAQPITTVHTVTSAANPVPISQLDSVPIVKGQTLTIQQPDGSVITTTDQRTTPDQLALCTKIIVAAAQKGVVIPQGADILSYSYLLN